MRVPEIAGSGSARPDPARRRRGAVATGAAVVAMAGLAAVTQLSGVAAAGSISSGTQFYVYPSSGVMKWDAANPGDSREPAIASRIASQPQGIWFANYTPSTVRSDASAITGAAAAAGKVPVLVMYNIPNRDCGGASAGGAPDISSYESYVQSFANGLGSHQVIVILEPDSLALQTCLSAQQAADRDGALAFAGRAIHTADPSAKVYMDAGHSGWNSPSSQASVLNAASVKTSADGIFSNVSNFMYTSDEVNYDKQVLAALGNPSNLHIVVDTSRNGNGPAPGNPWCDPSGRALGQTPTANTGDSAVDAYLWVKPPGESDGCADAAGVFDPSLAYALIANGPSYSPSPTPSASPTSASPSASPSKSPSNSPSASPSQSPSSSPSASSGSGTCHVTYTNQSVWPGGFTASVAINNAGSSAINGWTLTYRYGGDQKVTSAWGATSSQSGSTVTLTSVSWDASIAPGATLTGVGMQGTWASSNAAPSGFTLNGVACS
ncbi:glycoside hydrolase family 6 protein [Actinocrinis puniceicyclus]|uniref:Glucanase n=1 Tax=Actinocrinis puniceicyclus TaxID=977794 RepID=A0A8J7WVQ0_9ACTN|nr:glycoside hydrolase family 6 protein [Actinocrinis puniceicyclus]MBS2966705.1 glycoside hydrolase family 6 protein [Actinocrinis puniceicyclus]